MSGAERPNPIALLHEGIRLEEAEHRAAEGSKLGTLRGGNSGCIVNTEDGPRTIGGCARVALVRSLGIDLPEREEGQPYSKQHMFHAGHTSEDSWASALQRSWKGTLLREADVPTRWETSNGTVVSGRPDIVLADTGGKLVLGLELKLLCSIWSAVDVLADKAKTTHLCQAAHYSWQLGIPFDLMYISRVNWNAMAAHVQPWVARKFPRYGARHSEWCVYKLGSPTAATEATTYKNGKVKPGKEAKPAYEEVKRILPFVHGFNLRWVNGTGSEGTADSVSWRLQTKPCDLGDDAYTETLITQDGIRAFYESAANAVQTDVLPPEPAHLDADGSRSAYSSCGFCPLAPVCESYPGHSTKEWLRRVDEVARHDGTQL